MKKPPRNQALEYKKALMQIACMGEGIKPEMVDWKNVGKNAKHIANEALWPKCPKCGQKTG